MFAQAVAAAVTFVGKLAPAIEKVMVFPKAIPVAVTEVTAGMAKLVTYGVLVPPLTATPILGPSGVQVNCLLVVDVELITTRPEHPVVTGVIFAGKLFPDMVKVVSLPTAGLAALTLLIVAGGVFGVDEPEPQPLRARTMVTRAAGTVVLRMRVGNISNFEVNAIADLEIVRKPKFESTMVR
jgi:hypothetical protein